LQGTQGPAGAGAVRAPSELYLFTDFLVGSAFNALYQGYPWSGATIGGFGSGAIIATTANHPGVMRLSSGSGASNTGFGYMTQVQSIVLIGGEWTEMVFMTPSPLVPTMSFRFGWMDTSAVGPAVNQVAFRCINGQTIDGSIRIGGTTPATTQYTLALNTWYVARIDVVSLTSFKFTIFDMNRNVLWGPETITANDFTGKLMGHGIVPWNGVNAVAALVDVDWMSLYMPTTR
jgi:SO2946-like, C-terminal domain